MGAVEGRTGKVQTVQGLIDAEDLGVTIAHEHLFGNWVDAYYADHPNPPEGATGPVSMQNRWWVHQNMNNNRDNVVFESHDEAVYEVELFKQAGGRSIIEVSTVGLRVPGQAQKLLAVSEATGVNVVMGCGWYVKPAHPAYVADLTEDDMVETLLRDINEGMDDSGIKAGVIGEIGVSVPFYDIERQAVRAAVTVQRMTGVPIEIHPGMDDEILLDIVDTVRDAGATMDHVILCHQDCFGYSRETRLKALEAGCMLEFDTFGYTTWMNTATLGTPLGLPQPSDTQRVDDIEFFIDKGYGDRLLVSQDMFYKHARATYGGHGYSHILRNMVPYMTARGFTQDQLDDLLIRNPAHAFAFCAPVSTAAPESTVA